MEDYILDLEVDVNGEEVFMVNKRVISSYSGRISKLVGKSKGVTGRLKVIFNDFPGGAANFELITRFCYNNGKVNINPLNISSLTSAAHYMEMKSSVSKTENLFEQTEKSLEEIRYWTWSELLMALKQCQNLLPGVSSLSILENCLDSLIGRIASSCQTSPCPSISSSIAQDIDYHVTREVPRALRTRLLKPHGDFSFTIKNQDLVLLDDEKIKIVETVVEMLDSLDTRKSYLYDVNLVLRFLKSFLGKGVCCVPLSRLKKVASLMDLYLNEVAPDPYLKPSKFLALIGLYRTRLETRVTEYTMLCEFVSESREQLRIEVAMIWIMFKVVHSGLSVEQEAKVCLGLNYEKLSSEAFNHLAQNSKFPSKSAVQALVSQQRKLKSLLQNSNQSTLADSLPISFETEKEDEGSKQIVLYAKRLNLCDENEKLKAHLQGMQWRVVELENLCRKMQIHMTKMMKSRMSSQSNAKSVPKLCS
ncbi:hypothetical protein DH2020_011503 [Rehmannia glutinosa]|uniref:NPH3 domain-containing protein n=1 Tax=Rehmannia glutinosa TaxID=99300 RepID=A0ABR0XDJ9_REHGL